MQTDIKDKSDILLVELPPWDPRTPPLGIAYLATFLKSRGIGVEVFDLNIEMYNTESDTKKKGWLNEDFHWWHTSRLEERYLPMFEDFADRILSFDVSNIGFSATIPSIPFLNYLLGCLRKKAPDKTIIVGGPATYFYEKSRADFDADLVDYFVIGDGETALYEVLKGLKDTTCKIWKDKPFNKAACIQAAKVKDLDSIPAPTFEEFSLSSYTEGHFTLPIIFSKGCNRHCAFCSDTVLSHPYRCRRPRGVIKEIKAHLQRYPGINTFRLNDLSFNINLKFLNEFCSLIINEDLRIKWYGQAQVNPRVDRRLLSKMKRAGCRQFSMGLESFSDRVLSKMGKRYTAKEAVEFIRRSKDAGLENHIALIVGFPNETQEDFELTLGCIRENAAYIDRICSLNICGSPVGSELWRHPERYDYYWRPEGDWESYDHTNTPLVRKKRYSDVVRCCNELGIPVDGCWDLEIFEEQLKRREDFK